MLHKSLEVKVCVICLREMRASPPVANSLTWVCQRFWSQASEVHMHSLLLYENDNIPSGPASYVYLFYTLCASIP